MILLSLFLSAHVVGTNGLRVEGGLHTAGPYMVSVDLIRNASYLQTWQVFAKYQDARDGIYHSRFLGFGGAKSWVKPVGPFFSSLALKAGGSYNTEGAMGIAKKYSEWSGLLILEAVNEAYITPNLGLTLTLGGQALFPTGFSVVSGFVRAGIQFFN